ncbi:CYTH domain-containing protein [Oryzifoliimicrobium ureilyticus]|uniref:CYTH domain-containing protein n=1 Tax=Oryzifoliimicrobium ureilyticus TaxID=3113724 RepID=UPI003075FF0E
MAKEIERKFLVKSDGWKRDVESKSNFRQAYLAALDDRSLRVRIRDEASAKLTIKIGRTALIRDEFEYDIPLEDAEELMRAAVGNIIEKTRFRVPFGGYVWEVDVFAGMHAGLVMAEVEMQCGNDRPELPSWIGREVTGDFRYSNQSLATEAGQNLHVFSHSA